MVRVTYEGKDDAGHKFWVAHYGRYVIRIDANRASRCVNHQGSERSP